MKKIVALLFPVALAAVITGSIGCAKDGQLGNLKDFEGNVYKTIVIGEQTWMAENLKTTHYGDGTEVDGVKAYQNKEDNVATYGRLYTFDAATRNSETDKKGRIRGVCPKGWHIPTDADWKVLEKFLGMADADLDLIAWRGSAEGGMLKEEGTAHWATPNTDATNSSGFAALPGGSFNPGLGYTSQTLTAYFWSSTTITETESYGRVLQYINGQIGRYPSGKDLAFSVRCIKN
ncbi:MAG TPA: fibrobacter succinogenes major paralogous domain-containing protein [Bacteroidales bacterium]|nr:fibrobacter succinogenes major paralogous domain-containing protein [Bacteroidales bacterium]HRZ50201.1 fibrobacter succinogenes major paralogous domain-containing protein [Bacteroidales bacterium]